MSSYFFGRLETALGPSGVEKRVNTIDSIVEPVLDRFPPAETGGLMGW